MRFRFEQRVELPREVVFAFHEDPENLKALHQGLDGFRMIRHDGGVKPGNHTWIEVTVGRVLPVVLGFEHIVYEPPNRFGERLVHGPFSSFTHIHEFDEVGSGTVVRDVLDVEFPWWYGGAPATKVFLAPAIRRMFAFRGTALVRLAEGGDIVRYAERRLA